MNIVKSIQTCCEYLQSDKISERRQACKDLADFLCCENEAANFIKSNPRIWSILYKALINALRKESNRTYNELLSKGQIQSKISVDDVFVKYCMLTCKHDNGFNFTSLVNFITTCLSQRTMIISCGNSFLQILQQSILSNTMITGKFGPKRWSDLFFALTCLEHVSDHIDIKKWVETCMLCVKYGPQMGLPNVLLRDSLPFVLKFVLQLTPDSPRSVQESTIEMIHHFCLHICIDYRLSCCHLGEATILELFTLYDSKSIANNPIKLQLIEFGLLQVTLHKDPKNTDDSFVAQSQQRWKACLNYMFTILCNDATMNSMGRISNVEIFRTENGIKSVLPIFSELFVNVLQQLIIWKSRQEDIIDFQCSTLSNDSQVGMTTRPPRKRTKTGSVVSGLIDKIEDSKSCYWIDLATTFFTKYPEHLHSDDFHSLLTVLWDLQQSTNEENLNNAIFQCVNSLITIQEENNIKNLNEFEINTILEKVCQSSLRLIDSYQKLSSFHQFLRLLIITKNVQFLTIDSVLDNYTKLTKLESDEAFTTILHLYQCNPHLQSDQKQKKDILKWILKECNFISAIDFGSIKDVSKLLVCLTLKQWPLNIITEAPGKIELFSHIQYMNSVTYCQKIIGIDKNQNANDENYTNTKLDLKDCLDKKLVKDLQFELDIFTNTVLKNFNDISTVKHFEIVFHLISLLMSVLNNLLIFNIITDDELQDCLVFSTFLTTLNRLVNAVHNILQDTDDIKCVLALLLMLKKFLNMNNMNLRIAYELRKNISLNLINSLYQILCSNACRTGGSSHSNNTLFLQNLVMQCLISIACRESEEVDFQYMQNRILDKLLMYPYDTTTINSNADFNLLLLVVKGLTRCNKSRLPNTIIDKCLVELKKAFINRSHCCISAVQLLDHLSNLHGIKFSGENLVDFLNMILFFHTERLNYGPEVSIALIKCVEKLYKNHMVLTYTVDNRDEEIVYLIIDYLDSSYQSVRLTAIDIIANTFTTTSVSYDLQHYHLQEMLFSKIYAKLYNLAKDGSFNEGVDNNDSILKKVVKIDEDNKCSSTTLQCCCAIVASSTSWIEDGLLALWRICSKYNLRNIDTVLDVLARLLHCNNIEVFLEKYVELLVENWVENGLDLNSFPYVIYRCHSLSAFFIKYWSQLAVIIIKHNTIPLQTIETKSQKDTRTILTDVLPKVISHIIVDECTNNAFNINCNKTLLFVHSVLTKTMIENAIFANVNTIVVELLLFVHDELAYKEQFNEGIIFHKFHVNTISVMQFQQCLRELTKLTRYVTQDLISYLVKKKPDKVYDILLEIRLRLSNSTSLLDQQKYFHYYTIIADWSLTSALGNNHEFVEYFARDTIYVLLRYIKQHDQNAALGRVSCIFFKSFIAKLFPQYASILKPHILPIVLRLKNVALNSNGVLRDSCVAIMELLITDESKLFQDEIAKIDQIPIQFFNLYQLHLNVKRDRAETTLLECIQHFLELISIVDKNTEQSVENLQILHQSLRAKKNELKALQLGTNFDVIHRTVNNDNNTLILCRLLTVLMKLCQRSSENVRFEAQRCLGEIGPIDLHTVILGNCDNTSILSTLNHFKGDLYWLHISVFLVSSLSKYVLKSNVLLVIAASTALRAVLATPEGSGTFRFKTGSIVPSYLVPFKQPRGCTTTPIKLSLDHQTIRKLLKSSKLLSAITYKEWITMFACGLLKCFDDKCYFNTLISVCKLRVDFCEDLLPLLIYALIQDGLNCKLIEEFLNKFLDCHWRNTLKGIAHADNGIDQSICTNKSAVQIVLNVLRFLRSRSTELKPIQIEVNYLNAARAAQYCSEYFSCILYAELWCYQCQSNEIHFNGTANLLDAIYGSTDQESVKILLSILKQAYGAIGEDDALHTNHCKFLPNTQTTAEYLKHSDLWEHIWFNCSVALSPSDRKTTSTTDYNTNFSQIITNLNTYSLHEMTLLYNNKEGSTSQTCYESLWRLSQWDFPLKTEDSEPTDTDYSCCDKWKYFTLKACHDNDHVAYTKAVNGYYRCMSANLANTDVESCRNIYPILSNLLALNEIEQFASTTVLNPSQMKTIDPIIISQWRQTDEIVQNSFQVLEPVYVQRLILLNEYLERNPSTKLQALIVDLTLNFTESARNAKFYNQAKRQLLNLEKLCNLSDYDKTRIQLENAQLQWISNNKTYAQRIVGEICGQTQIDPRLHLIALKLLSKWLLDKYWKDGQLIIENYFKYFECKHKETEMKLGRKLTETESLVSAYHQLAQFADTKYQQTVIHTKSYNYQLKISNIARAEHAVNLITNGPNTLNRDDQKMLAIHQRQLKIDQTDLDNIGLEKNRFLKYALRYYLMGLIYSDVNNLSVFRAVSLLLANRTDQEVIDDVIEEFLHRIPTYQFVDILPQIAPHLAHDDVDQFAKVINTIVMDCTKDHPYHTVPILLALVHAQDDAQYSGTKRTTSTTHENSTQAKHILNSFQDVPRLQSIINQMDTLSNALIEFANGLPVQLTNQPCRMSKLLQITKISSLEHVPISTMKIPVDKSREYTDIISIVKYEKLYEMLGGKNCPKKITCCGSNGKQYKQLVKGCDDLHQDNVMQQVFNIINSLLSGSRSTSYLSVRTYKIVPLSMRSGILEWVENSIPFGEYLKGVDKKDPGAHGRYRPQDKDVMKCRKDFQKIATMPREKQLAAYHDICRKIQPVFHNFFIENFRDPAVWYETRRRYINSVATTSICGYILGIGDRHVNNILIDEHTGDVIHIDFGIAFEQGAVLSIPETVPFRLTRDVVDGMGPSGVEGVFRRSCERTMKILRSYSMTILAVLEVLLYDPLYDWIVTKNKAEKRQLQQDDNDNSLNLCDSNSINTLHADSTAKDGNVLAERALLRVRSKLRGIEFGGNPFSVEDQVENLIQDAIDPTKLCRLYYGWEPYL